MNNTQLLIIKHLLGVKHHPFPSCGYRHTGAVPEKIKGSSFVGVAATPLKPLPIASCYRVKRRGTSYRVLDMYM